MKTTTIQRTGSETIIPINIHDRINLKAHLMIHSKLKLHWTDLKKVYAFRNRFSVSFAIPNIISGDLYSF